MTDLLDDFVRARMEPIRDQLWAHGEITIAGLVRLDRALGIDTYNQCDGCMRGMPVRGGMHYDRQFAKPEMICTAERYTEASG